MAVVAIIVLIALLVAIVVARAVRKNSHPAVAPGPQNGLLPPGQERQPQQPGAPGFTRVPPAASGSFTEIRRTTQGASLTPPRGTDGKSGIIFGTVSINPTATCKLTGRQMADCACERCTQSKKKV